MSAHETREEALQGSLKVLSGSRARCQGVRIPKFLRRGMITESRFNRSRPFYKY